MLSTRHPDLVLRRKGRNYIRFSAITETTLN